MRQARALAWEHEPGIAHKEVQTSVREETWSRALRKDEAAPAGRWRGLQKVQQKVQQHTNRRLLAMPSELNDLQWTGEMVGSAATTDPQKVPLGSRLHLLIMA